MSSPNRSVGVVLATLLALVATAVLAQFPSEYHAGYRKIVTAAQREGQLVIYSSTDLSAAAPLISEFEMLYPGITVEYNEMNSPEVYARFVSETDVNGRSADVTWSSSMDLQIKLANDGYAESYRTPEARFLPPWAIWRDEAFGTTFEPAVFVYNKRLLKADEVPRTHAEFLRLLSQRGGKFNGNVTMYDIRRSAVGFLFLTQDSMAMPSFWEFVELEANTATMMERIASGKTLLGYNLLGSYAMARARHDPALGVVLPTDYTLVLSRVVVIAKRAPHPNAAKLWVDFLLSRRGQTIIGERSRLFSIRDDVEGEFTAASLMKKLGDSARPIPVGPGLLVHLDKSKRREFMKRWHWAIAPAP